MKRALLGLALLSWGAATPAAPMVMEVLPLHHRLAEEVIPVLRPLMPAQATLSGLGNQLIVRTTPDNLAEIKALLGSLDRAPQRLLITVRQDLATASTAREQALSGHYRDGDVAGALEDPGRGGARVTVRGADGSISYRDLDTRSSEGSRNEHRLQALEGRPAYISTGQSIPIPERTVWATPHGAVAQESVYYRDVASGFYVVPRLSGDLVHLDIHPRLEGLDPHNPGVIDTRSLATTVSGRLGEWIALGGLDQSEARDTRILAGRARGHAGAQGQIWVKVEALP
jgi:hypothetical protein